MNAYELAEGLFYGSNEMEYNYHFSDWKLLYESALTLQKLADRIAELEKHYSQEEVDKVVNKLREGSKDPNKWSNMMDEAMEMILTLQHRIAELEKEAEACWCQGHSEAYLKAKGRLPSQVSSKPVAWIGETLMGRQYINGSNGSLPVGTALYTHPVKQLSYGRLGEIFLQAEKNSFGKARLKPDGGISLRPDIEEFAYLIIKEITE